MVVEKNSRVHAILSVSEKMGRRAKKKKGGWQRKENMPMGKKIIPLSKEGAAHFRLFNGYFEKPVVATGTSAFLRRCG